MAALVRSSCRHLVRQPIRSNHPSHVPVRILSTSGTPSRSSSSTTSTTKLASSSALSLPRYPTATPLGLLRFLDYVGTLSFAHTGAYLAATSGMDLLGTLLIGTVTAVGGGTLRDALILARAPFWTSESEYLPLCILAGLATFYLAPTDLDCDSLLHFTTDTLGVGAFACIGALNGLRLGQTTQVAILCGMSTATFGGAVRDVLCKKDVRILHSHAEIYASVAAAGAGGLVMASRVGMPVGRSVGIGLAIALSGRALAWKKDVKLPVWQS